MVKKIGIDGTPLLKVKGGIGYYVFIILDNILKIDKENHYFIFCSQITSDINYFKKYNNVYIVEKKIRFFTESLWSQTHLSFLLYKNHIDIFLGLSQSIPLLKRKKMKTVLTIYDFCYLLFPETMSNGRRYYLKFLSSLFIKNTDIILVISSETGSKLNKFYKKKYTEVVRPPIKFFNLRNQENTYNLLKKNCLKKNSYAVCIASFEPRKNLINLLKSYIKALDYSKDLIPLVVIGGHGWKNTSIKKTIDFCKKNYPNKVIFMNFVSDEILGTILQNSKFLISHSVYEGYGMHLAEARSLEIPVIATDIPEHREAAENDGIFYQINDLDKNIKKWFSKSFNITKNNNSYESNKEIAKKMFMTYRDL